ncbi:MAG: hypothetical protein R3C97_00965 [Geminicoccaceae bacterium]
MGGRAGIFACMVLAGMLPRAGEGASIEAGDFEIVRAAIQGFAGVIEVSVVEEGRARLVISGEDGVLDGFEIRESDGELLVQAPKIEGPVSVVTGSVRASGGGEVVINGKRYGAGEPLPEPMRIELVLVRGTALDLVDLTGEAHLGDLEAPLHLQLLSGVVRAGSIGEASIHVEGGGQVEIAHIAGDAWLDLAGSGTIHVAGGEIGALLAEIGGAGMIEVGASVGEAKGSIFGAGMIRLGEVAGEPQFEVGPAGRVVVDGEP